MRKITFEKEYTIEQTCNENRTIEELREYRARWNDERLDEYLTAYEVRKIMAERGYTHWINRAGDAMPIEQFNPYGCLTLPNNAGMPWRGFILDNVVYDVLDEPHSEWHFVKQ